MFINLTNHPFELWDEKQQEEARKYGEVEDLTFPVVLPEASSDEVQKLAETYAAFIAKKAACEPVVVHVMGEMTFTYAIVSQLKAMNITCLASTTERNTVMIDGKKVSEFKFVRFREY